ncbi:MAG: hypothetical protein ACRDIY_17965 [Chloroflexota bacterium]
MRWVLRCGAALLLALGMVATAVAAAPDGQTAAAAIPLPASVSSSGTLTGSANGAFAFYTFNYPGHDTTGTITLNVTPTDSNTTNAAGVILYQNGVTLKTMNALGSTSGSNFGMFSSPNAGPVLVQVYNYLPGQAASYNFTITGVTAAATPMSPSTVTPASVAAPVATSSTRNGGSTAETAVPLPASVGASGTLTGSGNGTFAFYTFDYPGNGTTGTVTLDVTPNDPNLTNAVGINLYQNGATLKSLNALGTTSGVNSTTFSSATAGPVLVQVYNYLPGQTASYHFTITGASR